MQSPTVRVRKSSTRARASRDRELSGQFVQVCVGTVGVAVGVTINVGVGVLVGVGIAVNVGTALAVNLTMTAFWVAMARDVAVAATAETI